jgi:hypothetical protein
MADWQHLNIEGLGPIQRVTATFQVGPPLAWLPFPAFKVKVIERTGGSYLGVPNVAVRAADGSPDWVSGLGDTAEEALEDALNNFVRSLDGRQELPEGAFVWSDPHDF